ncbi:hypothetical protein B0T14DRAFT_260828 [Immersiella caudata]|uniref:Uncharacterized protein n=1 Tax=Immersiella caudata TaxID=314043 RepID=A0AA39WKS1_9PEZI|nr:hypothetical protein B0T14DRAFT_260828 [Immersiella caudata]
MPNSVGTSHPLLRHHQSAPPPRIDAADDVTALTDPACWRLEVQPHKKQVCLDSQAPGFGQHLSLHQQGLGNLGFRWCFQNGATRCYRGLGGVVEGLQRDQWTPIVLPGVTGPRSGGKRFCIEKDDGAWHTTFAQVDGLRRCRADLRQSELATALTRLPSTLVAVVGQNKLKLGSFGPAATPGPNPNQIGGSLGPRRHWWKRLDYLAPCCRVGPSFKIFPITVFLHACGDQNRPSKPPQPLRLANEESAEPSAHAVCCHQRPSR